MNVFCKRLFMFKRLFLLSIISVFILMAYTRYVLAGGMDDPLLTKVLIDQLEMRDAEGDNSWVLESQGWVGKDLEKFWFKTEVERKDGETEEAELQALYSRAIAPYWDLHGGLRKDFLPSPSRTWAVVGVQGLAPYYFEIDTALYIGESGHTALRIEAEYELLFTQRIILAPEIEANFYGQNDAELGMGSGLSDVEAGLRLRYEVYREFAPYIGVNWNKRFGKSADFARNKGEDTNEVQWVIGVRAWY